MSHRLLSEIQTEFQNLCLKAGHVQYQIVTLQKDLDAMNETIRDLNIEAAKSKAAEDESAAKESA